eukprot:CAMPEP_0194532604 /NCGR_PEP_ID=MMETSP0253-20130528/70216_1 /TAXON_ID=2966 /ORGANISM="Noctiluca scintillans" /LENGTH=56 /DNA_ID=CAMNT_0039378073 /DNA_START=1666 /DNA_END=1836 /DNA_ORIENTATION=+
MSLFEDSKRASATSQCSSVGLELPTEQSCNAVAQQPQDTAKYEKRSAVVRSCPGTA